MFAKLLLLFITIPVIELILFIKIGSKIGLPSTLAIIILTGFLGAFLTKQQGLRTWRKFQATSASGQLPANEAVDGLLILIAGAVLLTPGFLTDVVGFLLLVPMVRAAIRSQITGKLKDKINIVGQGATFTPGATPPGEGGERVASGRVVDSKPSNKDSETIDKLAP